MKITYKGDYALKALLNLAIHYGKGVVTINGLAKEIDAPIKFLEQVLLELKRGGFVESRRGKVGGYQLAKTPREISIGDVVRFIDGAIEPIDCVHKNYGECKDVRSCVFRPVWVDVARAISSIVDNVTFENLVDKVEGAKKEIAYSI